MTRRAATAPGATRTRDGGTGADSRKRSGSVTTRPEDDERATGSPTATRGAVPNGLELPQAAPPRSREERKRLAEVEESRERCLRLLTAKRSAKRDGRSRDSEADRPTGGEGAAREKGPGDGRKEARAADLKKLKDAEGTGPGPDPLRNDPAVLSCFKSGRDEPGLPWITETSRAMHCYLRVTDELPERAVLVFKASRYFLTVDWLLPVLDLIPSVAIRIKADAGIGEGESRRGMIADGIEAQTLEAVVDQAILVAVKLDADLSMWLRDYATAGADEGFPEITYLRHVTPHSRARVPSEEAWREA